MTNRRDSAESQDTERATSRRTDSSKGSGSSRRGSRVATLHGAQGNQAVQELARQGAIQPKLAVSDPDDASEREAERVAETVLAADEPVQTAEPDVAIQPSGGSAEGTAIDGDLQREIRSVTSGGRALPEATRGYFETRFGRDFGDVRVHTGGRADEAARSIDAEAFTHGTDIVFRSGAYQPGTRAGKQLLAHELTHVVQSGGVGRSVYRSPMSEDERGEMLSFSEQAQMRIESPWPTNPDSSMFEKALQGEIKRVFEKYDFDESEKQEFRKAIKNENLASFAAQYGGAGKWGEMKKLVTVIRAKSVLSQLADFEDKAGFKQNEDTIEQLRSDVETVQGSLENLDVLRKRAMASLFTDLNVAHVTNYTAELNQYLQSEALETDLAEMDPEDRSDFVEGKLKVLGALGTSSQSSQTTRKAIGTLFKVESQSRLLQISDQDKRTKALQRIIESQGDGTDQPFKQVLADAVGGSVDAAKIAKKLNAGLNDLDDAGTIDAEKWVNALEDTSGNATGAITFVRRLDDAGKLGSFVAAATFLSLDWPGDVEETIKQSGNVAAFAGAAPDIAKVAGLSGHLDEIPYLTKYGKALRFLGEWMGPAGDFLTSIADGISAYQEFKKGDVGSGIGSTVSAGGALAGGAMTVGGVIAGSSWWTGVGALVGLGVGLVGAGIGWLWGETTTERKLENMGLVEDTDTYLLPG